MQVQVSTRTLARKLPVHLLNLGKSYFTGLHALRLSHNIPAVDLLYAGKMFTRVKMFSCIALVRDDPWCHRHRLWRVEDEVSPLAEVSGLTLECLVFLDAGFNPIVFQWSLFNP